MRVTLDIDMKNAKALALLNYIRTLDFIALKENKASLSNEQKTAIDEGLKQLEQGKSFSHKQVMEETKKRYPNLSERW